MTGQVYTVRLESAATASAFLKKGTKLSVEADGLTKFV